MFHSYTIVFAKVINVFFFKLFSIVAYCFFGEIFWCKSVAVRHAIHFLQF